MTTTDVYFIDDELDLRLANEQSLELAGFGVALFEKAEDALPAIDERSAGVVVSDIRLPGMSGLDLLQALQQVDASLPVILITGHGDISMAVDAMQKGASMQEAVLSQTAPGRKQLDRAQKGA